uniref:Uncharacterized protein n=1 Tax=Octopus bimaculoides TaxID=37653 RepID=A0A0L8HRD2_OCTBM
MRKVLNIDNSLGREMQTCFLDSFFQTTSLITAQCIPISHWVRLIYPVWLLLIKPLLL